MTKRGMRTLPERNRPVVANLNALRRVSKAEAAEVDYCVNDRHANSWHGARMASVQRL
jgi:hypothetical protein